MNDWRYRFRPSQLRMLKEWDLFYGAILKEAIAVWDAEPARAASTSD